MATNIEKTAQKIEKYFYLHKPIKKKVFLALIKSLLIFFKMYNYSNPQVRATAFRLIYIYFREIDDIIDGDKILDTSIGNVSDYRLLVKEYMQYRVDYLKSNCTDQTTNELDEMMNKILELTNYLNLGLKDDFLKLMDCMLFDLERKCDLKNGQIILKSKEEIEKYFFQYYYESCFKIAVLLSAKENIDINNKNLKDY